MATGPNTKHRIPHIPHSILSRWHHPRNIPRRLDRSPFPPSVTARRILRAKGLPDALRSALSSRTSLLCPPPARKRETKRSVGRTCAHTAAIRIAPTAWRCAHSPSRRRLSSTLRRRTNARRKNHVLSVLSLSVFQCTLPLSGPFPVDSPLLALPAASLLRGLGQESYLPRCSDLRRGAGGYWEGLPDVTL